MNVPDKAKLFKEAYRVLRPAGVFAVYEVMRTDTGVLSFPVPWAEREELSALEAPGTYRKAAADAGFELQKSRIGAPWRSTLERVRSQAASPSPLGDCTSSWGRQSDRRRPT